MMIHYLWAITNIREKVRNVIDLQRLPGAKYIDKSTNVKLRIRFNKCHATFRNRPSVKTVSTGCG